ncbi:hypothetical protein B4099_1660 [Heyndrickxia coagulans]|uniref:Uncharacterized protein n=1 Tax=Heyndrickxia coagulans TaxID=1398 RepID=A0A150KID0_HEYCO|nr:hypothetical protein B4099_1660 [Heyndrickxia coagulans]
MVFRPEKSVRANRHPIKKTGKRIACFSWILLFKSVFFIKAINTSVSSREFLAPCIEWMAFGTYFHAQFIFYGTTFEFVAARTFDHYFFVFWMNSWFHAFHLLQP